MTSHCVRVCKKRSTAVRLIIASAVPSRTSMRENCASAPKLNNRSGPGFPFSKWTTNLIKCAKSPDKCGFGCDCGGQEAQQRWVKGKKGLFGSRSMTLCGLTFKGHG